MKTRRALVNRAQDTCRAFAKTEAAAGEVVNVAEADSEDLLDFLCREQIGGHGLASSLG